MEQQGEQLVVAGLSRDELRLFNGDASGLPRCGEDSAKVYWAIRILAGGSQSVPASRHLSHKVG
jgi:hypothetical protein